MFFAAVWNKDRECGRQTTIAGMGRLNVVRHASTLIVHDLLSENASCLSSRSMPDCRALVSTVPTGTGEPLLNGRRAAQEWSRNKVLFATGENQLGNSHGDP